MCKNCNCKESPNLVEMVKGWLKEQELPTVQIPESITRSSHGFYLWLDINEGVNDVNALIEEKIKPCEIKIGKSLFGGRLGIYFNDDKQVLSKNITDDFYHATSDMGWTEIPCKLVVCEFEDLANGDIFYEGDEDWYFIKLSHENICCASYDGNIFQYKNKILNEQLYKVTPIDG